MSIVDYSKQVYQAVVDYPKQVYKGYGHLYQASREISWEQLFLDPLQDTAIESSFEKMIQAGHSAAEIKIAKCCSGGFIEHLKPHLVQKTIATIAFPFVYPFLNGTSNIPGASIVTEPAAFFGVNPLEGLYSLVTLPKTLLGEDNIISKSAKYLAFREDYHQDRAKDENFNQYMKVYKGYMEVCDAWGHARTELRTLYKNKDLSSMPYKAYVYFRLKFYLYSNTIAEEAENDKKIENLKLSPQKQDSSDNEICFANETIRVFEDETCPRVKPISWSDWLYENKWKIAEEIATPLIFKKIYSITMSYFSTPTPKDIIEEDDTEAFSTQEDPYGDLPYDAPENPMFWGFDKQSVIFGLIRRQTDDQILEEAANRLAVRNRAFSSSSEEEDGDDKEVSNIIGAEGSLSDYDDDDLPFVGDGFVTPQQPEPGLPIVKLSPARSRSYSLEGYKTPSALTPLFFPIPIIDVIPEEGNFLPLQQLGDLDDNESMNNDSFTDDTPQIALPAARSYARFEMMKYCQIAGNLVLGKCANKKCTDQDCVDDH